MNSDGAPISRSGPHPGRIRRFVCCSGATALRRLKKAHWRSSRPINSGSTWLCLPITRPE
jgi:hypothetical protein